MPLGTARMQMRHLMHLVSVKIPVHLLYGFSVVFSETFAAEITINNQRRQRRNPLAFLPPPTTTTTNYQKTAMIYHCGWEM